MKLKILAVAVSTFSLVTSAQAKNVAQVERGTPAEASPTSEQVLQACAQDQAQTLPSPYTDVSQNHWAYKAVLSMYYCGAYRGQISPEQLQQQRRPAEM